jgi:hypothetical protein
MIRRLIAPVVVAVVTFHAGQVLAQGAFPAPLPGKAGPASDSPFPPVNGAAPPSSGAFGNTPPPSGGFGGAPAQASFPGSAPMSASPFAAPPTQGGAGDDCMKNFLPLRQEAEKRGQLLKEAGEKKVTAEEACKLINNFIQAETKMIKYVDINAAKCGIPPQIGEQLRKGHVGSEGMRARICGAAAQMKNAAATAGPAGPSLSEVLGSAATLPEAAVAKKSGGTTFDTLSGNALTR